MAHWMCTNCGHYLQTVEKPKQCPSCNEVSVFSDVTCYRPECGGETSVDPQLVEATVKKILRTHMGAKLSTKP